MTWRPRVKPPKLEELPPSRVPKEPQWSPFVPRRSADLERALGYDSARRIVEAASVLPREPMTEAPAHTLSETARDSYFNPGGYAGQEDSMAETRYLDWRRAATGRDPETWERSAPDPNMRLDLWVECELARAGLPDSLCPVVIRMAMVTMRDGVDAARRVLIEERAVPEQYHFAIDDVLKRIPPLL